MNDNMTWLFKWYYDHCDGDWEHGNGIKIGTIDNPGWYLKVSIDDIGKSNPSFPVVRNYRTETDWVHCAINDGIFEGHGGPFNLSEIIEIFRDWVEND